MEYPEQRKGRVALLVVRELKDGTVRQSKIRIFYLVVATLAVFVALIFLLVIVILTNLGNTKEVVDERDGIIEDLNAAIAQLQIENSELSNKVSILSDAVATNAALEEIRAEELEESQRPTGFPLGSTGRTTIEENEEDRLTMIFNADEGNTVISVGAGKVEAIETDADYGSRIIIDHQNGYKSVYMNNGQPLVRVGDELGRRYILFLIGANNKSLRFQIFENEQQVDPMEIMEISG
jgi:septal ring factor EnvC (AmiA/AmiB activator)